MAKRERRQRPEVPRRPLGERWAGGAQEVFLGLQDWRARHPQATLREIEVELDERLQHLRAQMLTDLALASAAADLARGERAVCPECGGALHDEGVRRRTVVTLGNQAVPLTRDDATCSACGIRIFPPGC